MERRVIRINGTVQGVGFRPFVHTLAARHRLAGVVKNQGGGVQIEVEGEPCDLDHFLAQLRTDAPSLARIEELSWVSQALRGDAVFRIEPSDTGPADAIFVPADVATCAACLAELLDPADRRHGYPFLNCTRCGPRLTIIEDMPWDRERTTMSGFALCSACAAEYSDPADRRFHAQPTACPACGPRLEVRDGHGDPISCPDPLAYAADALLRGQILAVKGLGGYHLACNARDSRAVAELRLRKQRDEKPFAIMAADIERARELCTISPGEEALLLAPQRPIVLLRRAASALVAAEVAPGNPLLGILLPYSPLHHLLLRRLDGLPLVLTSGNRADEPIAYRDPQAFAQLAGVADLFLTHNRPIRIRCDDSVTRLVAGAELPLRRSRGHAPRPLTLPRACPRPTLAVGGHMKVTFALGRGRHAFLSHHVGDLDHVEAYRACTEAIDHYERLFAMRPELLVCDLHPNYASTRYAVERARQAGLKCLAIQHHQAHVASCMAENGLDEPVIGVAFDGTGFGTDGAIWGGEFFIGDYRGFRRAAHLRYVALPGGEQAVREPWRMAVAHLLDAGQDRALLPVGVPAAWIGIVEKMIARQLHSPPTSSMGRLFDAVAALAGVRQRVHYEGQAAMELEWRALEAAPDGHYPFALIQGAEGGGGTGCLHIDTRPLIAAVADDVRAGRGAARIGRRFHATVVEIIASVCRRLREEAGLTAVVLSGGVFLNALLVEEGTARLAAEGFRVYRHRQVPPSDGGLCLGQLAIASATLP